MLIKFHPLINYPNSVIRFFINPKIEAVSNWKIQRGNIYTDEPEGNGICRICGDGDRRITTRRREKVKTKTNNGFTGNPII